MSSNFPPGVTGNEYEIAGPDREVEAERSCGAEDVTIRAVTLYGQTVLKEAQADLSIAKFATTDYRLRIVQNEINEVEVAECPFEGVVTAVWYRGTETWTCPLCDTQHERDVDED